MSKPQHIPVKRVAQTGRNDALVAAVATLAVAACMLAGLYGGTSSLDALWQEDMSLVEAAQNIRMHTDATGNPTTTEELLALAKAAPRPEKLADAEETINANAIVYRTLDDVHYTVHGRGVERSHEVWAHYPQLLVGGSYLTAEDRQTVHMIERNGQTFAFLCYTYGDNRYDSVEEFPNTYYSCGFDYAHAAADIARAKWVADCVIVVMHWGSEYEPEPNDQQRERAQWLADQDVDMVLGARAHTIQPVEYVEGKNGNQLLVVFGLSDFISGWDVTAPIVSGVFTCDMVHNSETGRIKPENPVWHPTIEWSDGTSPSYVRLLADMDRDTTNANIHTPDVDDDFLYTRTLTDQVITQIPVDWGESGGMTEVQSATEEEPQEETASQAEATAQEEPAGE